MGLRRIAQLITGYVAFCAAAWLASPGPVLAEAPAGFGAEATPTDDGSDLDAWEYGADGVPTISSGGDLSCDFVEAGPELNPAGYTGYQGDLKNFGTTNDLVEDSWYFVACTIDGDTQPWRFFQHTPSDGPAISPLSLAHRARDTLTIAFPDPHTSPPADLQQLVGFRTWLWITPDGYEPVTATASIPGLTVTATATPSQVVWDMGDNTNPVVCDNAGTAYDLDRPDDQQSTDCFHIYQWDGDYTATATVTWTITWSATNGDGGTLPTVERTTAFDLDVTERQAVIIDNP